MCPAALPNCVNCALSGPQPLEQAASGSVNGDNAAQPAADSVASVDGSASAHAIQVCTTQAKEKKIIVYAFQQL